MPGTQKLFAIYNDGSHNGHVYYKADTGSAWQDITPAGLDTGYSITDFDFTKQVRGKVVFSTSAKDSVSNLWIFDYSQPPGSQWTNFQFNVSHICTQYQARGDLIPCVSISGMDTAFMTFQTTTGLIMAKSPVSVANLQLVTASAKIPVFKVSPANAKVMYGAVHDGVNSLYRSENGGQNFINISGSDHADGRCIYIHTATNTTYGMSDRVYGGTDGGIVSKFPGSGVFQSITGDSLCITEFYSTATTEADEDILSAGAQDNGGFTYNKNSATPWYADIKGDNYITTFARNGVKSAIKERDFPELGEFDFASSPTWDTSYPNDEASSNYWSENNNIIRPLYFDTANNLYVGYSLIWQEPPGGASWSRAFHNDPQQGNSIDDRRVCDFIISEKNHDTAYIAYRYPAYADPTDAGWTLGGVNPHARLFVAFNTSQNPTTWTNITPPIVQYCRINDIETDPLHSNRIWIALGDIDWGNFYTAPASMKNRVYYSNNYGSTWTDVSAGLPDLPASKILYQKGSDDNIFVGTDVGVFKWNKTTSAWECFNTGLPTCVVTDLEFNYCARKLRISTFGRGIWETLVDTNIITPPISSFSDSITTNTTWGQDKYINGSIYVAPGQTLTLSNTTLHMPKNGRIAVAAKGKLIVDSSTITNDCASCMWKGIEAWGSNTKGQQPYNQATVIIKRHSVIQHARMGVANWDETDSNFSTTGGIIQASNSYFYNNHVSVSFAPYQNFTGSYPGIAARDISSFILDSFSIDNGYKGAPVEYKFMAHASIINDYGIIFAGCKFNSLKHAGVGIYAMEGGFYCLPYYAIGDFAHAHPYHSKFTGFERGIDVESAMLLNPDVSIDNADFDTCGTGVYISGQDNVSTTRCNFTVGDGAFVNDVTNNPCGQNIGIYAKNARMFRIEQNTMTGMGSSVITKYGVAVENSSEPGSTISNAIYKCNFSHLNYGCFANGYNGYYSSAGLHFICNSFNHDTVDIGVAATGSIPYQGSMDTSAGNTFAGGNIVNNGTHIMYYYNGSSQKPGRVNGLVYLDAAAYANSCAATFGDAVASPTAIGAGELTGLKSGFKNTQGPANGLNNTYNSLMDGGSTASMVNLIHSGRGATIVYDTLMAHTPYLSLAVLKAAGSSNVLSYSQYYNVLYACPDELRDADLIYFIQHSIPTPMQPGDISTLQTRAKTNTARTTLESQYYDASTLLGSYANKIMMGLKTDNDTTWLAFDTNSNNAQFDSTSSYGYLDSVGIWLQNMGDLSSKYELAGYYMYSNNYSAASSVLNNIPQTYNLSTQLKLQQNFYDTLYTILNGLHNAGRNVYQLTGGELTRLTRLATDTTYNTASIIANNLKNFGWTISFSSVVKSFPITCVQLPGALSGRLKQPEPQAMQNEPGVSSVIAYPNPTRDAVTFDYNILQYKGNAQLSISDAVGQLVMVMPLQNGQGSIKWDVSHMPSGIYIYKLSCGGMTIGTGKLTIIK